MIRAALNRVPGLGGWSEDPLWASFYDWTVEHPHAGGALWRVGINSDLRRLYRAADEIGPALLSGRALAIWCKSLLAGPSGSLDTTLENGASPNLRLHVECGSGTYVRSLVRDLGELLGCGAHVAQLRRLWVDPFREPRMWTLDALQNLREQAGDGVGAGGRQQPAALAVGGVAPGGCSPHRNHAG